MTMNNDVKLLIACHKKCDVPQDQLYLPMHVGAAGKEDIGFQRDDTGDNISEKNPVYCELTGVYWAWKNLSYDWLGLVHYRRFFTVKSSAYQKKNGKINSVLTEEELKPYLNRYKVLVPKKRHYDIETVYKHYAHTFSQEQLDETRKILAGKYPEYVSSWDKVMNSRGIYIFNMFIMNRELTDRYCTWLFDVLAALEERVDTSKMTAFEKRYAGRVSERLFNVWLDHEIETGNLKKADIHELPYLYLGEIDWPRKISSFLMAKLFHKKYEKSF